MIKSNLLKTNLLDEETGKEIYYYLKMHSISDHMTSQTVILTLVIFIILQSGCLTQAPIEKMDRPSEERTEEARNYFQPLGPYMVSFSTSRHPNLVASGPIRSQEEATGQGEAEGYFLEIDGGQTRIEIYGYYGRWMNASRLELGRHMEEAARERQITNLEVSYRLIDGHKGVTATGIRQGKNVFMAIYFLDAVDRHGQSLGSQRVLILSTWPQEDVERLLSTIQVRRSI